MEQLNCVKAIIVAITGAISAYLGALDKVLLVLIILMILDYITGLSASLYEGAGSSKKGLKGIIKKVMYLVVIVLALLIDWLILYIGSQFGIVLPFKAFFGILVMLWYVVNEMISILENAIRLEAKLPSFLKPFLDKLKEMLDQKGNEEIEKLD